jgi:hypothetical protein
MKRLLVPLLLTFLGWPHPAQAAENLLKDGGFEQYLARPDDQGRLLARCGAQSPVRFLTPDGKHFSGLEYRVIQTTDGWLAFVHNLDRQREQRVALVSDLKFKGLRNLTLESDLVPSFTAPAGETYILKLTNP